jgi:hypothetical protein
MKNTILLVLLLGGFMFGFAQNQFPKMPPDTQEIHFTYKRTSKIAVDEQGVYADSILFKTYFPELKYTKVTSPKVPYLNAVVPIEKFTDDDKVELTSMLYHENEFYLGTHFIKKNKTIISARRNDADIKAIFKKYFNKGYPEFSYRITIDYKKKTHYVKYPRVSYEKTFDEIQKEVKWFSPTEATFVEVGHNIQNTNVALFDENVSDMITFDYIFNNSTKGLVKVESIENTLELVEVHYK